MNELSTMLRDSLDFSLKIRLYLNTSQLIAYKRKGCNDSLDRVQRMVYVPFLQNRDIKELQEFLVGQ